VTCARHSERARARGVEEASFDVADSSSLYASQPLINSCCEKNKIEDPDVRSTKDSVRKYVNYLCIFICIYAYMWVCIYVFIYLCVCAYMYICIYVYMYICIYVYMYICILSYMYMYICIHVYTYTCIYVCMYIRIYVYMYDNIYRCLRYTKPRKRILR